MAEAKTQPPQEFEKVLTAARPRSHRSSDTTGR